MKIHILQLFGEAYKDDGVEEDGAHCFVLFHINKHSICTPLSPLCCIVLSLRGCMALLLRDDIGSNTRV